jgi:DNA repair exonuclease SbcCD nuclease subunit
MVRQSVEDCLTEAMDVDGFLEVLEGLRSGRIERVARDVPEPSAFARGVLSAKPYGFLDDAPLEERRTQAVFARRTLDVSSADELGALDPDAIRRVRDERLFNILMLHTDVEGQTNRPIPAVPVAKLKELKQLVAYVALGHTHKRFDLDGWAFNPGSLEPTSIDEYKEERGAFLVDVDEQHNITAQYINDYVQRPFQRLSFDVSGAEDADAVYEGVMKVIEREARKHDEDEEKPAPIIEITLRGQLGFKNSLLQINRMRDEARERTRALHVMMRNQSVPVEYAVAAGLDAQAPRHERERRIIEDLIARDNRYKARAREIAELVIEAKKQALSNESPDKILELIAQKLDQTEAKEIREAATEHAPTAAALSAIERNAQTAVMSNE